jgi:hypothetical protein
MQRTEGRKIKPEQVGYINAHGTVRYNDKLRNVGNDTFGEHAYKLASVRLSR